MYARLAVSILTLLFLPVPGALSRAEEPLDVQAVEAFVQDHFETGLATTGAPGAVVAIVQGDRTLLLRGFGSRDMDTGEPVDPEATLYRIGSITKPMTAIAILRLVERGELNLDTDVNRYLGPSPIPDTFTAPVTIRHLLTHTGGLDGDMSFSATSGQQAPPAMRPETIRRRLFRARPPGLVPAYDILGYGVLSLLVRETTGLDFQSALQEAVFQPAGMTRAVVGVPDGAPGFARCHVFTPSGAVAFCDHPRLVDLYQGSGAVAATAADMAAFMKALLHGDDGGESALLSPAMFATFTDLDQYRFHPRWRGLGLGLQELELAGRPAIGHGGAIQGFDTEMALFPEHDLGIYFGVNGSRDQVYDARLSMLPRLAAAQVPPELQEARQKLLDFIALFVDRFLPAPSPAVSAEPAEASGRPYEPANLEGLYLHARFVSDNILVNLSRLSLAAQVSATADGVLINGRGPYRQSEPGFFVTDDGRRAAFRLTSAGAWVSFGGEPFATYERTSRLALPMFSVLPLLPAVVLLLTSMLYLLPRFAGARRTGAAFWLAGMFLFVAGVVLELEYGVLLRELHGNGALPMLWRVGLWTATLAFLAAPLAVRPWQWPGWLQKVHGVLIAASGFYVVWFALFWGFLG